MLPGALGKDGWPVGVSSTTRVGMLAGCEVARGGGRGQVRLPISGAAVGMRAVVGPEDAVEGVAEPCMSSTAMISGSQLQSLRDAAHACGLQIYMPVAAVTIYARRSCS